MRRLERSLFLPRSARVPWSVTRLINNVLLVVQLDRFGDDEALDIGYTQISTRDWGSTCTSTRWRRPGNRLKERT
jgi:hypothetical protein